MVVVFVQIEIFHVFDVGGWMIIHFWIVQVHFFC